MKVVRHRYLNELVARKHNGLVKIITGIRRCGKSYLLNVLFKEHLLADGVRPDHIIEVPLDEDAFIGMRDALSLGAYIKSRLVADGAWNYVFIDEVQLAKKVLPEGVDPTRFAPEDQEDLFVTFYDTLNTLRKMDHVDVYVTGSNSKTLSSDIDTNFADRGCQIRVHPFSFSEYCEALQPADALAAFAQYLIWGGMPLAVAESDDDARARYLQGLYSEVYVNDICKRYRLRDDVVIGKLVDVMASAVGSLSNPHRMVGTLQSVMKVKANDHTVKAYIDYVRSAASLAKHLQSPTARTWAKMLLALDSVLNAAKSGYALGADISESKKLCELQRPAADELRVDITLAGIPSFNPAKAAKKTMTAKRRKHNGL